MKIRVLGSAAAEAVPAVWCECESCQQARENGGKDIRRRTSYLLDEDTLIDLGPDFLAQLFEFRIDERKLKRIIFTHRHEDHLNPMEFLWRRQNFSLVSRKLRIFAGADVFERMAAYGSLPGIHADFRDLMLDMHSLRPGVRVEDEDLSLLPIAADHDPGQNAMVHLLSRGGKKVFICHDSGALPEESMKLCAGAEADLMILEGTIGFFRPDWDQRHLGANAVLKQVERHRRNGTIRPDTKVVVNHFSHNGNPIHRKLEEFFSPHGIMVAYDGMEISL